MATVTFRIHYATRWGESLLFERRQLPATSGHPTRERLPMQYAGDGFWERSVNLPHPGELVEYRYVFRSLDGHDLHEPEFRRIAATAPTQWVLDSWLSPDWPEAAFLRQAFAGVIFQPDRTALDPSENLNGRRLEITLRAPRVGRGQRLCISGNHPLLGNWDPARARLMSGARYPRWEVELPAAEFSGRVEFKFGLWDVGSARLVELEDGAARWLPETPAAVDVAVVNCERFMHARPWKGAGVAIPVFSLRSERGYGVGEFADLAPFAEWAAQCGLHLVQLLPVNDTSSDFTWKDSYPYKAISTAALHPIYLDIERVYDECGVALPNGYGARRQTLNRLAQLDYEAVLKEKLDYLKKLFGQVRTQALADFEFKRYFREQADWLRPYAAFCRLRDRHGTADFTRWGDYSVYPAEQIHAWFEAGAAEHDEVMFHCWVQFHLERQLSAALAAGHARDVAFKGDLPIGIDRLSVEAWIEPELFRMDRQTGAPPDAFAVLGQNWGFPTYNWPRMEADGYAWWRRRFHRMSAAFDALRIDHILGFFRIWEIPREHREGILGHYNPTRPLSREEIRATGFTRDPTALGPGVAAEAMLSEFFGAQAKKVRRHLLAQSAEGFCRLRSEFATSRSRDAWTAKHCSQPDAEAIEEGLTRLGYEALFLEDPDQPEQFHPRINLMETALFRAMTAAEQALLVRLHDDYYHRRHTAFWADEAMKKLPALMDASRMLICGEDLGMVPDSVPMVLKRLGLLSLEVQRWPKRLGLRLGNPAEYPYLSVCTTSTHDMSTIRGWWEEEVEARQHFWADIMGREGSAPAACSPEICQFIVEQNLAGASMWCILPLQDWLGMDPQLRHPVAADERINVPAIPRHYWRYRMHLTIEVLLQARDFNRCVAEKVQVSERGGD